MTNALKAPVWRSLVLALGLSAAAGAASAMDVAVSIDTVNSGTNAGPFTAGAGTTFALDFRIDGSVTPVGPTPTWQQALDDMVLQVNDSVLGQFTITGQDGRWQQLSSTGDTLLGGWGGSNGGSLSALQVVNPAYSATPFVLTRVGFDLRGPDLVASATTLPGELSIGDFTFLSLVLQFTNADPAVGGGAKSTIIYKSAFTAVQISPVPEPAPAALLVAGLAAVAWRRRGQRAVALAA